MLDGLRSYFSLCGSLFYWLFLAPFRGKPYRVSLIFAQMVRIGVQAIPLSALIVFTIGIVLAMQSLAQVQQLGAEILVPGLISSTMIREFAPLITAVILIGRSGSAVTAELGTMKVSEEIDALEVMAIHPTSYLILPRFIAMLVMMPLLAVFGIYVGMFGGWLICASAIDMPIPFFVTQAIAFVYPVDLVICLLKSGVFGLLIVTIACTIGINVRGGAEGVGLATTRSVVLSLLAVFVANAIMTALFFF
ncbi:MAG: ABC transporter permease [Verrucomicrobiota bacterium]